jgi:hypothetical protein
MRLLGQEPQAKGQPHLVFDLPGRTVGRIQKVEVCRLGEAGCSFDNVRGDGNGRTSKLGGQSEYLFPFFSTRTRSSV